MEALWEQTKHRVRSEVSSNTYSLWIRPITFLKEKDGTLILGCPNKFSRNWVEENYLDLIRDKLHQAGGARFSVALQTATSSSSSTPPPSPSDPEQLTLPNVSRAPASPRLRLNQHFTFDRFVVGPSNEFAFSASEALARGTSINYPSLLMLANTGLGKSHLSQAVGHTILRENPNTRVFYMTAEDFANEMIFSLKTNRIDDFKNRYRKSCDVLLLEELHFLSGKEKTQTELGYTLDALANCNKKIIFTSSLPPNDIPRMSKQLTSRIASGLVTTIEKPDFETRLKILKRKAAEHSLCLPESILQLLATRLKRDVRQMESAMRCLKAKSELLNAEITPSLIRDVLKCLSPENSPASLGDIMNLVCKHYRIAPADLKSRTRKRIISHPRNIYAYLSRRHTDETVENIAKTINRSHATVIYASDLVERKIKTVYNVRKEVDFLIHKLNDTIS